jgi:hypothetical protein
MYTLQRKTQPTRHTLSRSIYVWPSTIHISRSPRITTFHESLTDLDESHCSRETRIPDYILSTPADRSSCPHLASLPLTASEAVGLSQASVDDKLLGLLGSDTSMRSVRSILPRGGQSIDLNRHRHGLQPWRCWLSTCHFPTFPTSGLHFSPKALTRSPV